jgi:hypothetical protein
VVLSSLSYKERRGEEMTVYWRKKDEAQQEVKRII